MLIGYNSSGKAEIKQGYLYVDDNRYYKVSELRALSAGFYDTSKFSNESENIFRMDQGRTIFLKMRLCNKANICSYKFVNSILFTREKAELMTSSAGEAVIHNFVPSEATRRKRDVTVSAIQIETPEGNFKHIVEGNFKHIVEGNFKHIVERNFKHIVERNLRYTIVKKYLKVTLNKNLVGYT